MSAKACDRFFVITGGPGSGKSTLGAVLCAKGFRCMPEAGRAVIQEQVAIGGTALPWADRAAFAERMLSEDVRSYREAEKLGGPMIFDRGVPDVLGYLQLSGLPVPSDVEQAAHTFRYNSRVFIAPPWQEIFVQDSERKQTWEEAEATYHVMVDVYSQLDYELMPLPLVSVAERVEFMRAMID